MIGRQISGIGIAAGVMTLVVLCGTAIAYFAGGGNGTAAAAVSKLTAPELTATANAGGTVSLSWTASGGPGGTINYYVARDGGTPGGNCSAKASPTTATSCTDSGVAIGSHEYRVVAVYRTWTSSSVVATVNVTVGAVARFSLTGTPTSAAAGEAVNLTIVAQDEKGSTVTTFAGSHDLVFSGAAASPGGNPPTVTPSGSTTGTAFGSTTAITFANGEAAVASGKNGVLRIYKPGEAKVTVAEGSLTNPSPLVVNISPAAASRYTMTAATPTPTAGAEDNLTITAFDPYGNVDSKYNGSHELIFSVTSTANSPGGNAPTAASSSGAKIAFGTATPVVFTNGVATSSGGANGAVTLYRSGPVTGLQATEGAITNPSSPTITVAPAAATKLSMTRTYENSVRAGIAETLTVAALDAYGNTATSYAGTKSLVFSGSGKSPLNNSPTATSASGEQKTFGTATPVEFAEGVATVPVTLYKAGSFTSLGAEDGTLSNASLAVSVIYGNASRVAWVSLTQSAGSGAGSCFVTCTITGVGNNGSVTGKLEIIDAYGNVVSNYGASKTITVSPSIGGVYGSPLSLPETGPAVTTSTFTFNYPSSGSTNATLTGASTGRTSVTATVTK